MSTTCLKAAHCSLSMLRRTYYSLTQPYYCSTISEYCSLGLHLPKAEQGSHHLFVISNDENIFKYIFKIYILNLEFSKHQAICLDQSD